MRRQIISLTRLYFKHIFVLFNAIELDRDGKNKKKISLHYFLLGYCEQYCYHRT